ncbi:MAG TPA: LytTR family DNA-binding domain-containing protein [Allosphingosinicella sp.]|jgi:hypothetical protein
MPLLNVESRLFAFIGERSRRPLVRALLALFALAAAAALFAGYCWLHALAVGASASLQAALRWGGVAALGAAALIALGWSGRRHVFRWLDRGAAFKAALFVPLAAAVAFAAATLHMLAVGASIGRVAIDPFARFFFDAVPAAAAVAMLLLIVPSLRARRLEAEAPPTDPVAADGWMPLPEMPNLRLRIRDVEAIRSAGNYSELHCGGRTYLVRVTLKTLEERLAAGGFVRVHRTCLVNARRIARVEPDPGRRAPVVHLDTGQQVPVGRIFRDVAAGIGASA